MYAAERAFVAAVALLVTTCASGGPSPREAASEPPARRCVEEWVDAAFTIPFAAGSAELDEGARARLRDTMDPMMVVTGPDIRRIRVGAHEDRCRREGATALAGRRARIVLEELVELEYARDRLDAVVVPPGDEPEHCGDDGPVGGHVRFSFLVCR